MFTFRSLLPSIFPKSEVSPHHSIFDAKVLLQLVEVSDILVDHLQQRQRTETGGKCMDPPYQGDGPEKEGRIFLQKFLFGRDVVVFFSFVFLVGGFNPFEKICSSNGIMKPQGSG